MRRPIGILAVIVLSGAACGGAPAETSQAAPTPVPSEGPSVPQDSAPPTQAPIGGTYEVDGRELAIACEGSGSPTFVIEGGEGMSMSDMGGLRAELTTRGTACTYGRAAAAGDALDGARVVADLHALLDLAEIPRPVVLVGHSAGGMFVQLYARLHPTDVSGVLALNPVPPWGPWSTEAFAVMEEDERDGETAYFAGENGESLDYATTSEQLDRAAAPPAVPFHLIISDETQCAGHDLCERVTPAYERIMRDVAEAWPGGEFAIVPASHEIHLDDAQAILDAVDDILAATGDAP